MPPRIFGMLNHDGIGQAVFLHPPLNHDGDAPCLGQNRQQGHVREVGDHFWQVERQARTHGDNLYAGFAGLTDVVSVRGHGLHHVNRYHAVAVGQLERGFDFAVKGNQVKPVVFGFVGEFKRLFDQVRVKVA